MKENINNFKNWYKIARPSKKYFAIAFGTALIYAICNFIEPIFAARVIISITDSQFFWTCVFLAIGFGFLVLRNVSWDLNYRIYHKLIGHSYMNLQEKIYDKIINGKESNFKENSKEKLINIIHNSVYDVSKFTDLIATRMSRLLRVVITIIAIFTINISVGLVIVLIDIINYFVLNYINSKRAEATKNISEAVDNEYVKFSEVIDSKNIVRDLNITRKVKKEYLKTCDGFLKAQYKSDVISSIKDNYYYVYYQLIILAITLFLVFLVSNRNINLTLYFIVIPYLTSGIEVANDFLEILSDLKNATVQANRLKIILNFTDKEIIEFGSNKNDNILGTIDFRNITYKGDEDGSNPKIKNIDFSIQEKETILFIGQRDCGKRTIFNLLRRNIKQSSGDIYIDGINLFDYSEGIHRTNINYLTTKPYFFSGSIIKNLKMIEPKQSKIDEVCRELGILNYIKHLPKGYKTPIDELPDGKKYLVQLARTLLTYSEIVILYEFPFVLSNDEKESVLNVLKKIKGTRTMLIFSAVDYCKDIADQIITFEKGTISKIKKFKK